MKNEVLYGNLRTKYLDISAISVLSYQSKGNERAQ